MVDILRIKFFAQRRYRENWPFMDGHWRACLPADRVASFGKGPSNIVPSSWGSS
jgi:hypothetical protein